MTDEQRQERLNYHMYTTCETPAEHAERIVALEELVAQAHECKIYGGFCDWCYKNKGCCPVERRMDELGVPR